MQVSTSHSAQMTSTERRAVASLGLLYAVRMLGLFMVLPVLAIYLVGYRGYSPAVLGFALGAYGLTQALFQIPFGLWSDKWGRKPVITVGLLIFAVGSVVAAMADSAWGVAIGRAMQGAGAVASTVMALVADVTRDNQRSKAMAAIGMSIGLTFGVSLFVGPLVADSFGLAGLFWLTAVLACVALVLLWLVVPAAPVVANKEVSPALELFSKVLADNDLLRLNVGIFCLHFVLTAIFTVVPTLLVDVAGLAVQQHWQAYLPLLLGSFVVMVPAMIYAEKKGQVKQVFCGAVALMLLALAMLSFAIGGAIYLMLYLFCFFVGFNLLEAQLPSLVSKQVFAGGRGTALGVYSTCQFLGIFAGGAGSGLLLNWYGGSGVFVLCTVVLFVWLCIAFAMRVPQAGKTLVVSLSAVGEQREELVQQLMALAGVKEVMVDQKAALAYVKADVQGFDQEQLEQLIAMAD